MGGRERDARDINFKVSKEYFVASEMIHCATKQTGTSFTDILKVDTTANLKITGLVQFVNEIIQLLKCYSLLMN